MNNLSCPTQIDFGVGASEQVFPAEGTILLSGNELENKNKTISTFVQRNGICLSQVYYKPHGEPNSDAVDQLSSTIRFPVQRIVAIGGGSTIDMAKGIALLLGSGGKITDYEFGDRVIDSVLPVWAIPTTCGSGSEVTPYIVINNSQTGRKFTLSDSRFIPQRAIIDPSLLSGLSQLSFRAGVLDALIHAFEARMSLQDNLLTNPLAEEVMQIVLASLSLIQDEGPPGTEQLVKFSQSSLYGGLSITHSRTGLIHTLSVAFARFVKEPHGLLNARLAPYVLRFNQLHYKGKLAELMDKLEPQRRWSDNSAVSYLCDWFVSCLPEHEISLQGDELVTVLADRVEQDAGLPQVNPRPIEREELEMLILEILRKEFSYAS